MTKEAEKQKQIILQVFSDVQDAVSLLMLLPDVVKLKQVEAIQKKLSSAAGGMTKVRTWMIENIRPEE